VQFNLHVLGHEEEYNSSRFKLNVSKLLYNLTYMKHFRNYHFWLEAD